MANILRRDRQQSVLHLLTEGTSIRAAERITRIHRDTICRLTVRFGDACRDFQDRMMRKLTLSHLEIDEMWTFVGKKQGRLTVNEKQVRYDAGDVYLWTAVDMETKLVPSFTLGKRSADVARRFMTDLAGRLVKPAPHASDSNAYWKGSYDPVTQISTDGFAAYPEAVDLAFGPYVRYGQLIKNYRNADQPGRYAPPEMIEAERRVVFGMGESELSTICTSHVERHNLTIRTFMKRFNRLTICFSKKLENLEAACAMYLAYYNFCWRPRMPGKSGRRRLTPAMAAGVTGHVWSFKELFETVLEGRG